MGRAGRRPPGLRPGRAPPQGRPPAAAQRGPAAGFLRLVRAVNGAPTRRLPLPPRSCLPREGPGKAGAAAFGEICAGGGDGRRPPGLRPGRAPLRGAPRCCAAGACGRLPAPCTGCKRSTDPPACPCPTQLPAGGGALSPGSAGELANAAVLLQIVRRHSIFGHFSCRTA